MEKREIIEEKEDETKEKRDETEPITLENQWKIDNSWETLMDKWNPKRKKPQQK